MLLELELPTYFVAVGGWKQTKYQAKYREVLMTRFSHPWSALMPMIIMSLSQKIGLKKVSEAVPFGVSGTLCNVITLGVIDVAAAAAIVVAVALFAVVVVVVVQTVACI